MGVEGSSLVSIIILLILLLPNSAFHHTYAFETWWWLVIFVEVQKLCSELQCYNPTDMLVAWADLLCNDTKAPPPSNVQYCAAVELVTFGLAVGYIGKCIHISECSK